MAGGRFRELLKKYGKVALGVHFTVSAASIAGLYVAVKNNVDVESIFAKIGMPTGITKEEDGKAEITKLPSSESVMNDEFVIHDGQAQPALQTRNRISEMAASAGGALTLAVLLNKALFPIRVPITVALTPPVARFLARRKIIKNSGLVN